MKAQFFKCPQEQEAQFSTACFKLESISKGVEMFFNGFFFYKIGISSVFKVRVKLNIKDITALLCYVF